MHWQRLNAPSMNACIYRGLSHYPKAEHPMKPFINQNGIKQRNNYLRTHLAKGCTKGVYIKHRCSQTQFKAREA